MLRQIARLGHEVPGAGGRALAVAVYGDATDRHVAAREAGTEGVACVDDAARALELYCVLWDRTRRPWARRWCQGLLDFVLSMQDGDGRFINFILDWDGTPNRVGRTSVAGGAFWQARAVLALARAAQHLDDDRVEPALRRGFEHLMLAVDVPADVRALHVRAALARLESADDPILRDLVAAWCEELVSCRQDTMLMNSIIERGEPHLWGHVQEGVLADAGALLGRPDLIDVARESAEAVFLRVIRSGFDQRRTQPYDVSSAVDVMDRLAAVTGEDEYGTLAAAARGWFDGRNTAGRPVYDRSAGRIADGIDHDRVSDRSGAEANIVGALALLDDTVTLARRLGGHEALPAAARGVSSASHRLG